MNGHSIQDIARRQRIPCGTVLSRIFTAKRLLRQAWDAMTLRTDARQAGEKDSPVGAARSRRLAAHAESAESIYCVQVTLVRPRDAPNGKVTLTVVMQMLS